MLDKDNIDEADLVITEERETDIDVVGVFELLMDFRRPP